ncbi:septum formation inhibitor Maf [Maribacter sp. 1_2014MBL_MicDiv]|uniref:septum formation inhibitor Maf n=1 Tax=Maribacter sp. 1_2014MBL_MicDiv TaxID=1644130 RepID=UPI0008F517D7|nr:septum formation inhibitor Maf [Maribacter sp. 1_2014MBL_MicDiv]APA65772.1 septum formation inhibitor Maf [Maribacter sp. 1_2014MBL_MicDiv]
MKSIKQLKPTTFFYSIFGVLLIFSSCKEKSEKNSDTIAMATTTPAVEVTKKQLSEEFKKYWYNGTAEITSYKLEQARYGEIREGSAVMIYVTEPFLPEQQVKADNSHKTNIPVLKLNSTKNYITGIYPYSIMTSSFYPVHDNQHAIKVSFSSQEWCGHVYAQLNNRDDFEITSHSYFESEGDQDYSIEKAILENEIWNKVRIDPKNLPIGEVSIVPSLEFIRLTHKELKAYNAITSLATKGNTNTYTINYPELERTLKINFENEFPYLIESWTDTFHDGFGDNKKVLTSKATRINRITTPYWQQKSNKDLSLRDSLGL